MYVRNSYSPVVRTIIFSSTLFWFLEAALEKKTSTKFALMAPYDTRTSAAIPID